MYVYIYTQVYYDAYFGKDTIRVGNELCSRIRLWKKSHAFKLCLNSTCFLFLHDIIPNYNYYYIPLEKEKTFKSKN